MCISLQDQVRRFERACDHFHEVGLCRQVLFYRAERCEDGIRGCWESHAIVADYCLKQGAQKALILEDDVLFSRSWRSISRTLEKALPQLPPSWWGLYVGHQPRKSYFVRPGILRSMSLCTHSYVANKPLLEWLASTPPFEASIPFEIGGVDYALQVLDNMYALFPMLAKQRPTGESFHRSPLVEWATMYRLAEIALLFRLPWDYMTFPPATEGTPYVSDTADAKEARLIRAAGYFDDDYYLRMNPDVARARTSPLLHYIRHGRREGRAPNAGEATRPQSCSIELQATSS